MQGVVDCSQGVVECFGFTDARTTFLVCMNERKFPRRGAYPSQSGYDTHPSWRYVRSGLVGMSAGR